MENVINLVILMFTSVGLYLFTFFIQVCNLYVLLNVSIIRLIFMKHCDCGKKVNNRKTKCQNVITIVTLHSVRHPCKVYGMSFFCFHLAYVGLRFVPPPKIIKKNGGNVVSRDEV